MTISTQTLRKLFLLGAAATFSLFGFNYWRVQTLYPTPIPVIFLSLFFGLGILAPLILWGRVRVRSEWRQYKFLALATGLFFLWHLLAIVPAPQKSIALKEASKLGVSLAVFWSLLTLFPRDQEFLERFWRVSLWSTVPLLLGIVYMNIFVHHRNFVTTDMTASGTTLGRNTLAWFTSIILPYAFFHFWTSRHKLASGWPLWILVVTLILTTSRSGWAAGLLSILFGCLAVWRTSRRDGFRLVLKIGIAAALMVVAGLWMISRVTNTDEIVQRFTYLYNPQSVPRLHSYESRWDRVILGWQAFLDSPIIGQGLGTNQRLSHNDYICILADTGIIGGFLWLMILCGVAKVCLNHPRQIKLMTWTSVASRGAFVGILFWFNVINIYTSTHLWIFLALIILSLEIERNHEKEFTIVN